MQQAQKVVITDCDHGSVEIERVIANEAGYELLLAQCSSEADVIAAARGASAILTQYAPVTANVLAALPDLRAVGRYGVGVDTVDVEAATANGVAVCNVPDYGTEDVSDHAIAHIVALLRGLPVLDKGMRRGISDLGPAQPLHRFSATTLGLYGLGLIGEATARKARGLGLNVMGSDPRFRPGETTPDGTPVVSPDQLLAQSDILSLHLPLIPQTKHILDDDAFARMKRGIKLVNTCRGGVVDTTALVRALDSGIVSAAGLDVFEEEPLPLTSELLRFEQVLLTPHAAWYSEESFSELKRRAMQNILDVCAGREVRNTVNALALAARAPKGAADV
ncbi:C-terminal binding protein [Pseudoclavibacter sp. AY1F1]|uniref:C-terminal binding protein n=1 Tax=Pseudoclavibacter sp. AY1F1 TaxID=2080583 RepID=UPI000CE88B4A|nr:C-terminal binding protein [Pseudoclavibacter sp. AY1F1]PPF45966.1 C-terminal binding protein [Pseudoclavibacter sp. AY1F1]